MVSVLDMAKILGLQAAARKDSLVVTAGKGRLQFVADAAAAWLDVELVPLAAPCISSGDGWFVESRSALKIFNRLLEKSGREPTLRWGAGELQSQPVKTPSKGLAGGTSPSGEQPKRPVLNGIRWGVHGDTIRAVIDCEGEGDPEIRQEKGRVKFTFSPGQTPLSGIPSPSQEVKAGMVHFGDRIVLELSSSFPVAEIIPLESPRRIVVDFRRTVPSDPASTGGKEERAAAGERNPEAGKAVRTSSPSQSSKKGGIVVLDAGHGGKDPGAMSNGIREKDVNLAVALLLAKKLRETGIDVRLTRDSDVYLTLQKRTDLANAWNADVFVSIHANAMPAGKHATGMEIYLMALPTDRDAMQLALIENREIAGVNGEAAQAADRKTKMLLNILGNMQQNAKISESTGFAEYLFERVSTGGIQMRRVAQAPFFVLRGAAMPAVLIETGFLTEKREAGLLADRNYQDKMASALAKGIVEFLGKN